jgi:hypothetical protein
LSSPLLENLLQKEDQVWELLDLIHILNRQWNGNSEKSFKHPFRQRAPRRRCAAMSVVICDLKSKLWSLDIEFVIGSFSSCSSKRTVLEAHLRIGIWHYLTIVAELIFAAVSSRRVPTVAYQCIVHDRPYWIFRYSVSRICDSLSRIRADKWRNTWLLTLKNVFLTVKKQMSSRSFSRSAA